MHLFASMSDDILEELRAVAVVTDNYAGHILFLEGDPAAGLHIVLHGRVKISRFARSGREQVVTVIQAGHYFNMVPVFDDRPCPANAQLLDDSRLLFLQTDDLRAVMARHPALSLALLHDIASFTRMLVNLVDDLSLHSVQGRLARLLLQNSDAVTAPLTQAEIAAQLGTVREMVGRSLRAFEALGLIRIDRGAVHILDSAGLYAQIEE